MVAEIALALENGSRAVEIDLPLDRDFRVKEARQVVVTVQAYSTDGPPIQDTSFFNDGVFIYRTDCGRVMVPLKDGVGQVIVHGAQPTNVTLSAIKDPNGSRYVPRFDQEIVLVSFR